MYITSTYHSLAKDDDTERKVPVGYTRSAAEAKDASANTLIISTAADKPRTRRVNKASVSI